MNIVFSSLTCLMLVFATVQYNDPDGLKWMAIYAIPAVTMLLSLLRPAALASLAGRVLLVLALVLLAVATARSWPEQAGFWHRDVWWEEETAREGMGLMIALLVTAVGLVPAFGRTRGAGAATPRTGAPMR